MDEQSFLPKKEHDRIDPLPRDVSAEFLNMSPDDFKFFLRKFRKDPWLDITIDWVDVQYARRLKSFVDNYEQDQKRTAAIRATEEQYHEDVNAFESGVQWIKV